MAKKITKRVVDSEGPAKKDRFLWDTEIKGFGVKVTPAGNRIYVLQYRINGRLRRYTIGRHGSPWTPHSARAEAARLAGLVASRVDPMEVKADKAGDRSVRQLCDEYLEAAPTIILKRFGRPKKTSTLATDRSNIEPHVKPLLGRRSIRSLTKRQVERFQQDVAEGKTTKDVKTPRGRAIVRGGRGTAARSLMALSAVLSYAVEHGYIRENVAHGVAPFKTPERDRSLSSTELGRLGEALRAAEQEGTNTYAVAALRLLLLTGCRKSEILTLKWDWVDFERACLRLPDSKTGAKVVPLGAPALAVLHSLPRIEGNDHVLPGSVEGAHLVGLQKVWARIRNRAGLKGLRIHDMRHAWASVAVVGGDSLYLVGKVLGHRQASTTQRYAHVRDDPLQAVAERASGAIAAALEGRKGDVVDLKKSR